MTIEQGAAAPSVEAQPSVETQTVESSVSNDVQHHETTQQPRHEEQRQETSFTRDQVARIHKDATQKAYEKAYKDFEAKQRQTPAAVIDESRVRQLIDEKAAQQVKSYLDYQINDAFGSKLEDARKAIPDFDDVTADLELSSLDSATKVLFNQYDNAGDMLYEFGKHPDKLGNVLNLAKSPKLVTKALKTLSESIKANKQAMSQPQANKPLSQVPPSNTGLDNRRMTIADLRRKPSLRA